MCTRHEISSTQFNYLSYNRSRSLVQSRTLVVWNVYVDIQINGQYRLISVEWKSRVSIHEVLMIQN